MSDESPYAKSTYRRTCEAIAELGIDPNKIVVNGLSTRGYYWVKLDENGRRIREPDGKPVILYSEWASLSDGIKVVEIFLSEGGRHLGDFDNGDL